MNLSQVWGIFTKIIDISILWLAFYYILKNIKNNIKMVLIVKGVIIILAVKVIYCWCYIRIHCCMGTTCYNSYLSTRNT